MPPEYLPLITITIPIVSSIVVASWIQNKRLDDIRDDMKELRKDMNAGFEKIQKTLADHGERIAKLEGRIPPLVRN